MRYLLYSMGYSPIYAPDFCDQRLELVFGNAVKFVWHGCSSLAVYTRLHFKQAAASVVSDTFPRIRHFQP